jgi:hypothetical protein
MSLTLALRAIPLPEGEGRNGLCNCHACHAEMWYPEGIVQYHEATMTDMPPEATPEPSEPADAPVKRIRRGCMFIIGLLVLAVGFNFFQYRINVITIVGGILLALALVGFVIISRE